MVQVHACVSVHCDQCGDNPGGPAFEAHYPTETAALDAATAEGWRVGLGGRLWCSTCAPVLTCEQEGHEFTPWRAAVIEKCQRLVGAPEPTVVSVAGQRVVGSNRYCRRCCLHESRPTALRIGSHRGQGTRATMPALSVVHEAGEVA